MGKRRYEQICVRFHLDEERDRQIFQTVINLKDERFKSKNHFILNAIESYIEQTHVDEDFVTRSEFEALQQEVEEMREQLKKEIRTELYEQLLGVMMGSTVANLAVVNRKDYTSKEEPAAKTKTEDKYDLGSGDGLLEDVMKWS